MQGSILIVEDDIQIANLMKYHLNGEGHKTTFATDGSGAWDMLQQAQPDLIILDEEMPGMRGGELLRKIRATASCRQIPVIFASGCSEEGLKSTVFEHGANDYMSKPFSGGELTVRVNYQLKIARLQKELREQKMRLQTILDNAVDAIITFDETHRVESFNLAAECIFGWRAEEIVGRDIELLLPVRFPAAAAESRRPRAFLATAQIIAPGCRIEGRRRNGESFPVEIGVSKTLIGKRCLFIALLRDITELVRTESELARHRARLEVLVKAQTTKLAYSNQMLKSFTWSASHDLQEPLRTIIGFAHLLSKDCGKTLDEAGLRYVKQIAAAGRRMREFIDAQLVFSLLEDSEQPYRQVKLDGIVAAVLEDLEFLILETGARITYGSLPTINANALQMRQLFYNLILNGLTFRREGIPPEIAIDHRGMKPDCWEIAVRDNGIGFDNRYREQIFSPFKRLHAKDRFSGSGMGLAICRRVVEYHNGQIFAQGDFGCGSTFFVRLPATLPVD